MGMCRARRGEGPEGQNRLQLQSNAPRTTTTPLGPEPQPDRTSIRPSLNRCDSITHRDLIVDPHGVAIIGPLSAIIPHSHLT